MIVRTDPALLDSVQTDLTYPPNRYAEQYGSKIATEHRIRYAGRLRRVYTRQYSNSGSAYVVVDGTEVLLDIDIEYALKGRDWTQEAA